MKKLLSVLALSAIMCPVFAQTLRTPAPSPTQTLKQDFALSTVELSYSRPAVKERKIFGDLVPYGKVWRTGANQATTITFGEEVTFGDKKVPAGKYGLLTIPETGDWTVILTKQLDVTSPSAYKQDQDVARVKVKADELPFAIESFMMVFDNIKPSSMNLVILWDKTAVSVPISSDVESKVMAQIDNLMNKDNRPYFNAAMYYLDNGKDLNKALSWFDKAIEQNPKAFWVYHQKANALAKLGKKQEAITSANKSIELAKEAKNDDYVALNQKLLTTLK
jgi:tetratricopeptide (TPR) repeat protein